MLESSWVRVRREDFKGYRVMVGICYRPPNQEDVDKAFFKQRKEVSELLMVVHMGDLNLLTSAGSAT